MILIGRFLFYVGLNLFFPLIRPIIRRKRSVDFVVLVYPGQDRDIRAYVLFKCLRKIVPVVSLAGLFIKDGGRRGITVATPFSAEEMEKDKDLTLKVKKELERFAKSVGARSAAIVGRLPSIMARHKIAISPPIVKGEKGTLFTLISTIEAILKEENLFLNPRIGVLGVGYIGGQLLRSLKTAGFTVYGIDNNKNRLFDNENGIVLSTEPESVEKCDVLIVLTPKGSDVEYVIPYLRSGIIIIDDTHPSIPDYLLERICNEKKGKIYKVTLGLGEMVSFPHWPGYDRRWLPGCVIEAIVCTVADKYDFTSQEEFNKIAEKVGFRPFLIKL